MRLHSINTEEYPLGVFHPHVDMHHIKKENTALIEGMGAFLRFMDAVNQEV